MAQASVSRQSIQEAIAALDAQPINPDSNDGLAEAVAVARQALVLALGPDAPPETQPVAVLIADLSGYTAIAEHMDAEQVREAINAMWSELDRVVSDWGGRVEQHAGDSLVALFGVPWQRPSDAWRAVQTALALQLELSSFNARVQQKAGELGQASWQELWPGPQMRIGVHLGPLAAAWDDYGASPVPAGETLRVAYELEEAALPGAILVSDSVRQASGATFRYDQPRPRRTRRPSFQVVGPRLQEPDWQSGPAGDNVLTDGVSTNFVGRTEALDALEDALRRAGDTGSLEIVTFVGETGSGKTRLLHEFLPRLRLLAHDARILRARLHTQDLTRPYGLLRDLLVRYLDIYPAHSANAIRSRITQSTLGRRLEDQPGHLAAVEQLLLPGDGPVPSLFTMTSLAQTLLMEAAGDGLLVIAADDIHHADPYSLALVDSLLQAEVPAAVLFICLAQPSLLQRPAATAVSWLSEAADPFLPATRMILPPLSAVESRLLAAELLRPASPVPQRLIDLVVADANGNPWAIEETVRELIDRRLIVPGTRRQVDLAPIETASLPRTLGELIEARLQQLPALDRRVIGAAAAVGDVFWDSAVFELLAGEVSEPEILTSLACLAVSGWVTSDHHQSLGDAQAHYFVRTFAQATAYGLLTIEQRDRYATQLAGWRQSIKTGSNRAGWILPRSVPSPNEPDTELTSTKAMPHRYE